MARRPKSCVSLRSRYIFQPDIGLPQRHGLCTGVVILIVYVIHLMDTCHSDESIGEKSDGNVTQNDPLDSITIEPFVPSESIQSEDSDHYFFQKDDIFNKKANDSDKRTNDIIYKLQLDVTTDHAITDKITSQSDGENVSVLQTTQIPTPFTRKKIYIRGHLLNHPPPETKTFHPPEAAEKGYFQEPNSVHMHRVYNFRDEENSNNSTRKKRKHTEKKERFHNYKLLYDTIQGATVPGRKKTDFYAWIFGAVMLAIGSLTTITSCFVFCFYGKKVHKKPAAHIIRRASVKSRDYRRVGSVSSIVDNAGDPPDSIYDENLESLYEDQADSVYEDHPDSLYEDQIDNVTII